MSELSPNDADRGSAKRAAAESGPGRPSRRWGVWVLGLLVIGMVVLGVSAVLVLLEARRAEASLRDAVVTVEKVQSAVLSGEADAVAPELSLLREQTGVAVSNTDGPHWWIAAHTPFVGESVAAVQTVARVVDDLATSALPSLGEAVKVLDPSVLMPQQGKINARAFVEVASDVIAADDAVQASRIRLTKIDETRVISRVAGPVSELKDMVGKTAKVTEMASKAAQLVPPMLGAYGQRDYVILAQSPAEIRATGGHPGAALQLSVDDGQLSLGDRRGGGELFSATPILPLTPQEELLFTDRLMTFGVDATLTPDFPRTAEITRAQWSKAFGVDVSGVIAIDPVALGYLLEATGPVKMSDGSTLNSGNAAQVLLNGIYLDKRKTIAQQDDYFSEAAHAVFNAFLEGTPNVRAGLAAVTKAAEEGRWLVWSAEPREQSLLTGTALSGELVGEKDGSPVVGVYLNDASATKMSYYLDYSVQVDRSKCLAGDARQLTTTVDIKSTAPPEAAGYPPYLSGTGQVTPGHSLTNVMVYSPSGGRIVDVTVDGASYSAMGLYVHHDMEVAQVTVDLGPGESHRLEVVMETAGAGQLGTTQLRVTPGSKLGARIVKDSTC